MNDNSEQEKIIHKVFQRAKELKMSNDNELPFASNNLATNIKDEAQSKIEFAYNQGYAERDAEIKAQLATHPLAPLLILAKNLVIEIINHWVAVSLPEAPASVNLKLKSSNNGDYMLTIRNHKLSSIIANIPLMEASLIKGGWKLGGGGGNGYKAPPPTLPSAAPSQPQPIPVARQATGGPASMMAATPVAPAVEQEQVFEPTHLVRSEANGVVRYRARGAPFSKFGIPIYEEALGAASWLPSDLTRDKFDDEGRRDITGLYVAHYEQNEKWKKVTRLVAKQ